MKKLHILLFCFWQIIICLGQQTDDLKWWNPQSADFQVIEGQGWPAQVKAPYDRLPAYMEDRVRYAVWNLSTQSAGLMIRFRSNASEIVVRYATDVTEMEQGVQRNYAKNHMPATGVSGVDLYAIDSDGIERWCAAKRTFRDTIIYRYENLIPNDRYHDRGREYRIYLPLYNQVAWMEIGVPDSSYFEALPTRLDKPIVVYGTSIAQGACASRPGMAWTNILSRKMDRPLINLGFSGNGKLETPLIELMSDIDAKIYILDCMPNMIPWAWERAGIRDGNDLKNRIKKAVLGLRANQPSIPILLVEHAGYTDEYANEQRKSAYQIANKFQKEAYYELQKEGVGQLYYLTKEEIGLGIDDMVDGTHPTDLGMSHYAAAYEKTLRKILEEPEGDLSTTRAITQYREPNNYDWEHRYREIISLNHTDPPKQVILANSIVHFWGGVPRSQLAREEASWETSFTPLGLRNFAYGWDRIENVLWRVYHGELDGFNADRILLMIGTNNLHLNTDEEIIAGLQQLVEAVKFRQARAEVVLLGLLPRRNYESRIRSLNFKIARLANSMEAQYGDMGSVLLNSELKVEESLFSDGLHPNAEGYLRLRKELTPFLK